MGYRRCMSCKGKGYHLIKVENLYILLEKSTPFVRNGQLTSLCEKCRGEGYFGPSFK